MITKIMKENTTLTVLNKYLQKPHTLWVTIILLSLSQLVIPFFFNLLYEYSIVIMQIAGIPNANPFAQTDKVLSKALVNLIFAPFSGLIDIPKMNLPGVVPTV